MAAASLGAFEPADYAVIAASGKQDGQRRDASSWPDPRAVTERFPACCRSHCGKLHAHANFCWLPHHCLSPPPDLQGSPPAWRCWPARTPSPGGAAAVAQAAAARASKRSHGTSMCSGTAVQPSRCCLQPGRCVGRLSHALAVRGWQKAHAGLPPGKSSRTTLGTCLPPAATVAPTPPATPPPLASLPAAAAVAAAAHQQPMGLEFLPAAARGGCLGRRWLDVSHLPDSLPGLPAPLLRLHHAAHADCGAQVGAGGGGGVRAGAAAAGGGGFGGRVLAGRR